MTVSSVGSSSLTQQMLQLQQTMFTSADADSDGALSLSEFQSIGQNVQGGGQRPPPPPMGGSGGPGGNFSGDTLRSLMSVQMLGSDAGSIISDGDTDADGLLSADEISTALSAKAPDGAKGLGLEAKMAEDMIAALDSDSDGALSSDEIAAGLSKASSAMQGMGGPPPGPPPSGGSSSTSATDSSGVFDSLDTNQDGTVSIEELFAAGADSTNAAKSTSADSATSLSKVLSSSSLASDLMQKLLAQLDTALTAKAGSTSGVSATA